MRFRDSVAFAREKLTVLRAIPSQSKMMSVLAIDALNEGRVDLLEALLEASKTQGLSWEATKLTAIELIAQRGELPLQLTEWLIGYLADEIHEPKRPKRFSRSWPGEHTERDIEIHAVVCELLKEGAMTPTRNDVSSPTSACDAVAQAMTELGVPPSSYKEIKRIFLGREAELREGRNVLSPVSVMSLLIKDTR